MTNKKNGRILRSTFTKVSLVLILVAVVVSQCGVVLGHAAFSGRVIDAATGQPIAGAVVVAVWELVGLHSTVGVFEFGEIVTDADGHYSVPGWGPRFNSRFFWTSMYQGSPRLVVFKSGYYPEFRINYRKSWATPFFFRADSLQELTIPLEPSEERSYDDANRVSEIDTNIRGLLTRPDCAWRHIPNLLIEMDRTGRRLIDEGIDGRGLLITRIPHKNCDDPARVLKYQGIETTMP